MNILLINHYAGSDLMGMEYRPFYLACEWVASGHSVTVLAADWSHLRGRQPSVSADLESTEEEGVRFRWFRTNRYHGNSAWRVANMLVFVSKLHLHADRITREERPDVVICSSTYPLDIYPGARIARKADAQLIFEMHDLWPLTPILLGGYSPRHPYIRVLQRAEDYAYHNADMVVSILPHARDHMVERGLDPRKFVHVPNGVPVARMFRADVSERPGPVEELVAQERGRRRFLIGFAGGINVSTPIETLLDAARLLAAADVSFLIAGDGPRAGLLREQVAHSGLDNFHLLGRIPKSAIQRFLLRADALAIPLHRSPLYRFGISPNKLFDYMLAGKPILQASNASNDLVAEAECGFTVEPEDPAAFADAVLRLRALSEDERQRLGENGRRFVIENHDYAVLARRFLDAVRGGPFNDLPTATRPDLVQADGRTV
jgi:glycosyltransferase involved in cell wall biosynthesis